ncbi:MAG: ribosome small subunit-dependent GTPase A [Clostridia bacterium]|nr:ribosome small subunit-dependent GTPase A [Clostridia bacterium]
MIGKVISCVGGIYTVLCDGERYHIYAKGAFRHSGMTPVAGDEVRFETDNSDKGMIVEILPRKNVLVRPEVANIDVMFIVFALASPDPSLLAIDKMTVVAEHSGIEAVIVFNKRDVADPAFTEKMRDIYERAGYRVIVLSAAENTDEVKNALYPLAKGRVAVFTGPSGVGKSTIINALYPDLKLETGGISEKNRRGKNTTRTTTLYEAGEGGTFLVDTPGFTLLDFDRFRFMKKEELVYAFPEYSKLVGDCRYTKCTHTKEEGCAILEKTADGTLPESRHESYLALWEVLKNHKDWEK